MTNTPTEPTDTPPTPTPTPSAPPVPAESPNPEAKPIKSRFVQRMLENSAIKPVDIDNPPPLDNRPLHQRMAEINAQAEAKANAADGDVGDASPAAATPAGAVPPVEPPKPTKKSRLIKIDAAPAPTAVVQPAAQPTPPPAAVVQPAPQSAAPTPAPAADLNQGLDEDQVDRIRVIEFAEARNPEKYKGKAEEMRAYFKKEAEWTAKNPEPLESEMRDFISAHMPKISQSELRQMEREMWVTEAETRIEKKLKPEIEKVQEDARRDKYMKEVQPIIQTAVAKIDAAMLDSESEVPGGFEPYFAPIGLVESEKGRDVAAARFPIEYPIYQGTKAAAEEYMKIVTSTVAFDPKNTTHAWLANFQNTEEQKIMADPAARVRNGKTFASQYEYSEMLRNDPAKAASHFTIDPEDILNAMVVNAHKVVDEQVKRLEAAGFKRSTVAKAQQAPASGTPDPAPAKQPATPPPADASASPKATSTRQPGAADTTIHKPKGGLFSAMMAK